MLRLYILEYQILCILFFFFFFNDTATTEIYTLSLHDALPIFDKIDQKKKGSGMLGINFLAVVVAAIAAFVARAGIAATTTRSGEDKSELPSPPQLVCPLLPLKKKKKTAITSTTNSDEQPTHTS